jgi:transaldolase
MMIHEIDHVRPMANESGNWAWPAWIECSKRAQSPTPGAESGPLLGLYADDGQSPWLDHLTRKDLVTGRLSRLVGAGVRGVTVNRGILAGALETSPEYVEQLSSLLLNRRTTEEAHWELAATDVQAACAVLRPVYESSSTEDGFVSVEIAPSQARRTSSAIAAVHDLRDRIDRPNLLIGIPASARGVPALQAAVSAGFNTNATAIRSTDRYATVIDAYLAGLEKFVEDGGDPAAVHGVASFFLGGVTAEVERYLDSLGCDRAPARSDRDPATLAQAARRLFRRRFSSERWERLARRGARPQRLLWMLSGATPEAARGLSGTEDLVAPNTICVLSEAAALSMLEETEWRDTGRGRLRAAAPRRNPGTPVIGHSAVRPESRGHLGRRRRAASAHRCRQAVPTTPIPPREG